MRKLGMIERTGLRRRLRALVAVVAGLVAIAGPARSGRRGPGDLHGVSGGLMRRSPRATAMTAAISLVAAVLIGGVQPARAGSPIDLTVTIMRFQEVDDPDPGPFQGVGDYYARVQIGPNPVQSSFDVHVDDAADIEPYWTFTVTVDSDLGSIPVQIEMLDHDEGPAAPDDPIDIDPNDGDLPLNLTYELSAGTWSGDVPPNEGWAQGDGDTEHVDEGGERGRILFDVSTSADGDIDDDGIPDGVERFGVRDIEGNVVADMAALGADPCRKTIALEIDFMEGAPDHTHRPQDGALEELTRAFDNSWVGGVPASECPYEGFPVRVGGVNLVIDVSNAIPEQQVHDFGTDFDTTRRNNFDPARRPYFHYAVFVHDLPDDSFAGLCCSQRKDFIVSLGSWAGQTGTQRDQAMTVMHELGHSLGLGHGGGDKINYKPNYLSVMNYVFSAGIFSASTGTSWIDYSKVALPDLDETALDENAGISDGDLFTRWRDPTGTSHGDRADGPLDWNWNDAIDESTVTVDLNGDSICVTRGEDDTLDSTVSGDDVVVLGHVIKDGEDRTCQSTASGDDEQKRPVGHVQEDILTGFDDWSNLSYRAPLSPTAAGPVVPPHDDITFEEAEEIKADVEAMLDPDLTVSKSVDATDALAGDTLQYEVVVTNEGTGTATDVTVTDTLPDGSVENRNLADIGEGHTREEGFRYEIPCSTRDGTVLTNAAAVSATNLLGEPEDDTSDNGDTASTTVHAPAIELHKSAGAQVNAGEAVTYGLTYSNGGSAAASNVVITDTLPADTYYSRALDLGAGPPPDSVANNPDGTTTLTWEVGAVPPSSGPFTIEYTARPSLLLLQDDSVSNGAALTFQNASGCVYEAAEASASTAITAVPPSQDPRGIGFWSSHSGEWSTELLASIQATDQRYDGADGSVPDGQLSPVEVQMTLAPGGNQPETLRKQLLGTYFNLGSRRINAGTLISSPTADRLGLSNVREAALFAMETLALPVEGATRQRYSDATTVLDEINNNQSEVY